MINNIYDLNGIIAVLNTPFSDDGKDVLYKELENHVLYALDCGVRGFLVPALASEVYTLSDEERIKMIKTVIKVVDGRAKVIACATAKTQAERCEILKSLVDLGCDIINVVIEYENNDQYEKQVKELAALNPKALMIQDWSEGYGVPEQVIVKLFNEIQSFKYYKIETVPANLKYSKILSLTENKLIVGGGWAVSQMYDALERGVHMMMPTGMYEIYVKIYDLHNAGKKEMAKKLFNELLPILAFSNQCLEVSILYFKMLMKHQGIYTNDTYRQKELGIDEKMIQTANEFLIYTIDLIERVKNEY